MLTFALFELVVNVVIAIVVEVKDRFDEVVEKNIRAARDFFVEEGN